MMNNAVNGGGKIGVALFGLGRIGQIHILNLASDPRVEIRWIVEEMQGAARDFIAQKLRSANASRVQLITSKDVDHVWRDPMTNVIVVCTPSSTHRKLILGGLEAGKAVFCEKPLAPSVSEVIECYEKAKAAGQILYCGFQRRFDPSFRALRDRVQAGEIGSIRTVQCVSRDPTPPPLDYLRNAGDLYHDSAIHDIDVVCWIIGEAPITVFAQGHAFHPHVKEVGDLDETIIVLKFPSGAMATIHLSREANFGYDQRLEVLGSAGMIQMDNKRETTVSLHSKGGSTVNPPLAYFLERYREAYRLEMDHFLDVVTGKAGTQEVTADEVTRSLTISDLCTQSWKEGAVKRYTDS